MWHKLHSWEIYNCLFAITSRYSGLATATMTRVVRANDAIPRFSCKIRERDRIFIREEKGETSVNRSRRRNPDSEFLDASHNVTVSRRGRGRGTTRDSRIPHLTRNIQGTIFVRDNLAFMRLKKAIPASWCSISRATSATYRELTWMSRGSCSPLSSRCSHPSSRSSGYNRFYDTLRTRLPRCAVQVSWSTILRAYSEKHAQDRSQNK